MAKEHKRMTPDQLRACKGFEGYTDEEAMETIKSLERLSGVFYELHQTHEFDSNGELVKKKAPKVTLDSNDEL